MFAPLVLAIGWVALRKRSTPSVPRLVVGVLLLVAGIAGFVLTSRLPDEYFVLLVVASALYVAGGLVLLLQYLVARPAA